MCLQFFHQGQEEGKIFFSFFFEFIDFLLQHFFTDASTIFMPVNLGNWHWVLAVATVARKAKYNLCIFDSSEDKKKKNSVKIMQVSFFLCIFFMFLKM